EPETLAYVEVRLSGTGSVDLEPFRQTFDRAREVGDAQRDVLQRSAFPRALGLEQRQLAAPGIRPDERELVGALDHVHPEIRGDEAGDGIAVGDPKRDMVECAGPHAATIPIGSRVTESPIASPRARAVVGPCSSSSGP